MKYKVLGNLKHNLKNYTNGDIIELENNIAEELLRDGLIEKIEEVVLEENIKVNEVEIKKSKKSKK